MHYFTFNIGDYLKDAGFMPPLEHGVYLLLILQYFATEKPIPIDDAIAVGRAGEQAVERVLRRFFQKRAAGWWHGRIEAEISAYREISTKRSKAGKLGGRPPKKQKVSRKKQSESQPLPSNHKPEELSASANAETDAETLARFGLLPPPTDDEKAARASRTDAPIAKIIGLYHELLPELPALEKRTKARDGAIRQRWIQDLPTQDHWRHFFAHVRQSDFLMGRAPARDGRAPFRATLEWLTRESHFANVKEGKYHG